MAIEGFVKVWQWFCSQFSDFNLITMAMVPLLISVAASYVDSKHRRRSVYISELIKRAIDLNNNSQDKIVAHKARKDELMSQSTSSSPLEKKIKIVGDLEKIINGTTRILGKLHDKSNHRKLKEIVAEMSELEIEYSKIEYDKNHKQ